MVDFESKLTSEELTDKWDEYTSPSRFAGSDDTMDLIFVSKRKGNKIKLIRRPRSNREPFGTIFRGHIVQTEQGSKISGVFTKSLFDYIFVGLINAFLVYIRMVFATRGDSLGTVNSLLVCGVIGGFLLLFNTRSAKRKYADFIVRITGGENDKFLSKRELAERENADQ